MQTSHVQGPHLSGPSPSGVPAAALILCSQMQGYIRSCAAQYSRNSDDREDLYLDIVVRLLEYPERVQHAKQFIRTTARNLAINRSRIGSRYWEITESGLTPADDDSVDLPLESRAAVKPTETDPLDTMILQDTLLRMEECLLPSEKRVYSLLQEGYQQSDLAQLLAVSKQAVSKVIHSIREKFLAAEATETKTKILEQG